MNEDSKQKYILKYKESEIKRQAGLEDYYNIAFNKFKEKFPELERNSEGGDLNIDPRSKVKILGYYGKLDGLHITIYRTREGADSYDIGYIFDEVDLGRFLSSQNQ